MGRVAEPPADATAATASSALLRLLPGDEFLPSAGLVAAVNALAGTAAPVGRDPDAEQLLRDEVEAFASGYWGLTPADRRSAWTELSRRGADAARLRELEPGLDVSAPPLADPAAEELAALFRDLFVLPPRERAIRRNAWLLEHAPDVDKWRAARAVVRRDAPALAALEPDLGAALDPGFHLGFTAFVEGASAAPIAVAPVEPVEIRAARQVAPRPGGGGWNGGPTIGGAALFGLFVIVKLLSMLGRSDTTTNSPSVPRLPNYSAPATNPPRPVVPVARTYTPTEVAEFEQYELQKAEGRDVQAPLAYAGWRLAGRPRGATPPEQPRTVIHFDRFVIQDCDGYERKKSGPKPVLYDVWLTAGKPALPGSYPILNPDPERR